MQTDTVSTTDRDGYGIDRIFIGSHASMHSETPMVETLDEVRFSKVLGPSEQGRSWSCRSGST